MRFASIWRCHAREVQLWWVQQIVRLVARTPYYIPPWVSTILYYLWPNSFSLQWVSIIYSSILLLSCRDFSRRYLNSTCGAYELKSWVKRSKEMQNNISNTRKLHAYTIVIINYYEFGNLGNKQFWRNVRERSLKPDWILLSQWLETNAV